MIKSRRLRWAGRVARIEEIRSLGRILIGKPEVKRPLGRLRSIWEDNTKTDLKEIERVGVDYIHRAQYSGGFL
jgi:hypothetical protein